MSGIDVALRTSLCAGSAVLALLLAPVTARGAELYGGVGTTGAELGVAQKVSESMAIRLEADALSYRTHFSTNGIEYAAKLKATNAGLYADAFVLGALRLTGGALVGSRKYHGTANSLGSSVTINGVSYPVAAGDTLDFDAKFPSVTPYLGLGYGHRRAGTGLQVYADAGVAYGRPKVTLSPSASLAAKVSSGDLAAEQSSVQQKADRYRVYPVLKVGLSVAF